MPGKLTRHFELYLPLVPLNPPPFRSCCCVPCCFLRILFCFLRSQKREKEENKIQACARNTNICKRKAEESAYVKARGKIQRINKTRNVRPAPAPDRSFRRVISFPSTPNWKSNCEQPFRCRALEREKKKQREKGVGGLQLWAFRSLLTQKVSV